MKIILASKSGVRKQILDKHDIDNEVIVSNVDEDEVKESLLAEGADPLSISNTTKSGGINIIDLANYNSCSFIKCEQLPIVRMIHIIANPADILLYFTILKNCNKSLLL